MAGDRRVGLLLLKSWARPVLWLSFVATVVNRGWVFAYSAAASLPLGVTIIVAQLILALVAERLRGWPDCTLAEPHLSE